MKTYISIGTAAGILTLTAIFLFLVCNQREKRRRKATKDTEVEFEGNYPRYGKLGLAGNDSWVELDSAEGMKPDLMGEKGGARCMLGFWRWVEIGFLCNWGL